MSLASARAVYGRLAAAAGRVTPAAVLALGPDRLGRIGFTRGKARYALELARRVEAGELRLAALARLPDDAAAAELERVPGIGPWTAGIYLLMALQRPDVWPRGDLALAVALRETHGLAAVPSTGAAAAHAERWMPWRAVAARILWHGYLIRRR